MENQHQKIIGYRDLSQPEIDLMNEGKALAEQVGAFVAKVSDHGIRTYGPDVTKSGDVDHRWLAIGRTHLQQGFMAVTRAIAKPTTF
jgi:hypothetical protein